MTEATSIKNIFKGFMKFLSKYKMSADWQMSQNEVLPSMKKSKFCLVTGKSIKINYQKIQSKTDLKPCLAKDDTTNLEIAKHHMTSCALWNSLTFRVFISDF